MHSRILRDGAVTLATLVAETGGVFAASPARAASGPLTASVAAVHSREDHCPGGTYCVWKVVNATGGLY